MNIHTPTHISTQALILEPVEEDDAEQDEEDEDDDDEEDSSSDDNDSTAAAHAAAIGHSPAPIRATVAAVETTQLATPSLEPKDEEKGETEKMVAPDETSKDGVEPMEGVESTAEATATTAPAPEENGKPASQPTPPDSEMPHADEAIAAADETTPADATGPPPVTTAPKKRIRYRTRKAALRSRRRPASDCRP